MKDPRTRLPHLGSRIRARLLDERRKAEKNTTAVGNSTPLQRHFDLLRAQIGSDIRAGVQESAYGIGCRDKEMNSAGRLGRSLPCLVWLALLPRPIVL